MRFILAALLSLTLATQAVAGAHNPGYEKDFMGGQKGCQPFTDGTAKVIVGGIAGAAFMVGVTWVGAIVSGPFTAGASFVAAWAATPAAFAAGLKGGAIAGAYLEAGPCIAVALDESEKKE